mmetsp:Transcript_77656/g.219585  ORF Transcript_77656/g.219585 Transcript_77656/m.219585 type:complete len:119 (+) Transcript_77656:236-592(+)
MADGTAAAACACVGVCTETLPACWGLLPPGVGDSTTGLLLVFAMAVRGVPAEAVGLDSNGVGGVTPGYSVTGPTNLCMDGGIGIGDQSCGGVGMDGGGGGAGVRQAAAAAAVCCCCWC